MTFNLITFFEGLAVTFGLIMAIGMQNAFVLKQGIMRNHVLAVVLVCAFSDSILIILGVNGLGQLWESNLVLQKLANWGGILFLSCYGIKSFLSAFKNKDMVIYNETDYQSLKYVILVAFSVSFLNPHGFLDTCVFMSSIASNFSEELRPSFTIGAISASFIWFTVLGFGARYLRKLFEKQIAWKILDIVIGCMMFAIVLSLLIKII
jgi:L-lysine exporter family protein LysE/ArgO